MGYLDGMKVCGHCHQEKRHNKNGRGWLRNACIDCEMKMRLRAKKKKLKDIKDVSTTHGGSTASRQKTKRVKVEVNKEVRP